MIQDALGQMAKLGYKLSSLTLDNKIHRFDGKSKLSAWYIGFQNHSVKGGEPYVVVNFGDFNGGENHTFKPGKLAKADQTAIAEQIAANAKRAAEEKAKANEETAKRAKAIFTEGGPITGYMERKKIADHYGTGTAPDADLNPTLIIPMRDIEGDIWNLQRIFDDGNKRPLTGGRISGLMHIIGGPIEKVAYVCEGYSTGASIYQAIQKPVVVAFNCHNLVKVAIELSKKFPSTKLTICGDDDAFGEKNAGRECAEEAAEASLSIAVFPKFKDTKNQPTDFNDLHYAEGLAAVSDQILGKKLEAKGFLPLGIAGDKYYFYNKENRMVSSFSQFTKTNLYRLAPEKYWAARYGYDGKYDTNQVADFLVQLSMTIGKFNTSRLRGAGVWLDEGRVVVNSGVTIDQVEDSDSWYVYTASEKKLPRSDEISLTVSECSLLVDVCESIKWIDAKSGPFLAGWLAVSRIAGALPVRPHAWLTGGAGTGKTTVMGFIETLLGSPNGLLNVLGSSTEAGIRQAVKDLAIPVIFDEFETTDLRSSERVRAIVDLMRASWSNTGGSLLKGTAEGQFIEFRANFAALVSSIRVNLDNDADRSRFTILELDRHGDDLAHFNQLKARLKKIDHAYGRRLFARMVGQIDNITASYNLLRDEIAKRASQRYGQQVGMILAGYHALKSDKALTQAEAVELAHGFVIEDDELPENDAVELLKFILSSKITIRNCSSIVDISIGDAIELPAYQNDLRTYGFKKEPHVLYVSNSHAEVAKLLQHTRWAKEWWRTLQRLPGSKKKHMRFGSTLHRCTGVILNDPELSTA